MSATSDIPTGLSPDAARDRRRLVDLTASKKAIEADLKNVKEQLAEVSERVMAHLADEGLDSVKDASSGKTIYLNRRIWARAATDKPAACEALRQAGGVLADYVEETFNTNSLSAYFREEAKRIAAETGQPVTDLGVLLPDDLREHIALTEDHVLGVRG